MVGVTGFVYLKRFVCLQTVCLLHLVHYLLVGAARHGWQLREGQWLSRWHHVLTVWDSK